MTHSPRPPNAPLKIRILATSDLHMNLCGFDYYSDTPDPSIGFTRTAHLIRAARQEAEAQGAMVLLFDNGDSLQGTPLGEWAVQPENAPHILMRAFGDLGYDAIGLGNHDFSFGLNTLDQVIAASSCPVICSNAHRLDASPSWQGHTIVTKTGLYKGQPVSLRIGVFSVLPPQTAKWEAHKLEKMVVMDGILACAAEKVADLKSLGCDLIIALAHTGIGPTKGDSDLENAIIPLAALDGIDALIAGHSHLTLPGKAHDGFAHVDAKQGKVHGKPVVMPGAAGANLGLVDLELDRLEGSEWRVRYSHVELRSVCPSKSGASPAPVAKDPVLRQLFAPGHLETRRRTAQHIGQTDRHLHSYFSFCAPDRGLVLTAAAQAAAVRPYLQTTPFAGLPVLSAAAPSKVGGRAGPRYFTDIPAGQIFVRHVNDLCIFPNELRAVLVDGRQVTDWLEMSASVFNRIQPGQHADMINTNRAGYNFDVLQGLTYRIDLSQPPRFDLAGHLISPTHQRIRNICFEGQPLTADQRFVVASNNYRANGGGHFRFMEAAERITLPPLLVQRALQDYLSGSLPRDPLEAAPYPFTFVPVQGATCLLRTGPKAQAHIAELDSFDPQVIGTDDEGFLLIRLTL
ncbi:bifunctional 2',3'-cyclic-nucleotide 2'-phosphodiesterase/3'-nucleotidase [Ruegeria profundi]|uniref:Bifunctional metallophosphatase/5'-nucleotidase n=1 Tax=Ruegeria profundi TaxID=1685378 RepID=A0A0X3TTN5_9RHOB|nr:bifunctional 2',3'-cyclic-nucleotide 2'-phosphodiesterase/3'-nucleotidase [Ruegeria profundi]KUJ79078.1 bifunctional metallophosphatase/5'-nucleotidase [Ruegeria profundi]